MTFEVTEFTVIKYKVLLSLCCTSHSSFKLGFPRKQRFNGLSSRKLASFQTLRSFRENFCLEKMNGGFLFFFFLDLLKVEVQCSVLLSVHTEEKLSYSCAAALCR